MLSNRRAEMNHTSAKDFDYATLSPDVGSSPDPNPRAIYRSTKTYDHNEGLSCCFRQWKAVHSHCSLLHGYALSFAFVFATRELDERNWCFDFGGMKEIKSWLHHMFDHTMLVAADDPHRDKFEALAKDGLVDLRVMPAVGCEATAKITYDYVSDYVSRKTEGRVWLESVQVREHSGNSAIYELS
ncbi:MAG TPA: 6-carboxytetrahydropterin synthase [Xanthobacteraceae bacterium]|nr:6-carboxytetrahydropterin synthase [Xanthobacteraceae bacterium]